MNVPDTTRSTLKKKLWQRADEIGWVTLSPTEKSLHYEIWTRSPEIGGRLVRFMRQDQIRVYIKDTLLKDYTRFHLAGHERPFRVLGVPESTCIVETYSKPHGCRLHDGRVICWGRASDWKSILMALHERTFGKSRNIPHAAVLLYALGKFREVQVRAQVEDVAKKLGVSKVVWLE